MMSIDRLWLALSHLVNEISMDSKSAQSGGDSDIISSPAQLRIVSLSYRDAHTGKNVNLFVMWCAGTTDKDFKRMFSRCPPVILTRVKRRERPISGSKPFRLPLLTPLACSHHALSTRTHLRQGTPRHSPTANRQPQASWAS